MGLTDLYIQKCSEVSDIYYHLPKLRELASKSNHVTEMGVRGGVSTIALLMGNPKKLVSYDINPAPHFLFSLEHNTEFVFHQENVLEIEIEPTEFLFIDTLHNYKQITKELLLHSSKVSKWIAFHDTQLFRFHGESYEGKQEGGIYPAIQEFLETNPEWKIKYETTENNGLTVIEKG